MAVNELQFQSELIAAAVASGGHAVKLSHRYLSGVPDLWVKLPGLPGAMIEAKWIGASGYPVLTAPQREFLMADDAAGGVAGVVMAIKTGPTSWEAGVFTMERIKGRGPLRMSPKVMGFDAMLVTRERGKLWPIEKMVRHLRTGLRL